MDTATKLQSVLQPALWRGTAKMVGNGDSGKNMIPLERAPQEEQNGATQQ